MNRILHILKTVNEPEAFRVIAAQSEQTPRDLSILLIQKAVHLQPTVSADIYVLEEDAQKEGVVSKFKLIPYSKMLDLILSSDSVVVW